ncbi:hypothetical protein LIER_27017 [Lithospermum erythrorhizon]|uniref:Uncharacterized protein n=1 Tax=Lithospermum erythrorhizon TaxID=34254 RepID=A0AAV3RE85_LITER
MAEDFKRLQNQLMLSEQNILHKVYTYISTESERYTREIMAEKNIQVPEEELHAIDHLNSQQKKGFQYDI